MATLQQYITQVQRLLHDALSQYWPQAELTDYINEARNRVAQDSKCLRTLATGISLTQGQDFYTPQTMVPAPQGANLVAVMGITVYWGTRRVKLKYYPFTDFDAKYRPYSGFTAMPGAFTRMGANNLVIGPAPDQNYVTDWDIAVIPPPLVLVTDVETIPVPFIEPVQYYAAYKAKWKEQAMGEAAIFKKQYLEVLGWSSRSYMQWIVRNPYRIRA